MEPRSSWLVLALIACVATLSIVEAVRVTALRLRAVDLPGGRRAHRVPTARLGGLGIFWGFALALAAATYGHAPWRLPIHAGTLGLIGILAGSGLMLIVGLLDDVYGLRAGAKLALQTAAAACLWQLGVRVESVGVPGVGSWEAGALSLPLTLGWVVLVTNALNLIDGLDGLAAGLGLVAALGASWLLADSGAPSFPAAAALAGALAGFLWFNLNPALIFMGDTGSLFTGFALAALTLRAGQAASPAAFPLVPALLLAVPLVDALDAIARRTLAAARAARAPAAFPRELRARLFKPDRSHVHHRLVRRGLTTRRAVAVLWAAGTAFAVAAVVTARAPWPGLVLALALAVPAAACLRALEPGAVRAGLASPLAPARPLAPGAARAAARGLAQPAPALGALPGRVLPLPAPEVLVLATPEPVGEPEPAEITTQAA